MLRRLSLDRAAVAAVLFATSAAPLFAQRQTTASASPTRSLTERRFWGAFSLGNATASLSCSVCRDFSDRSVAAGLTLGVRQTSRFYLGAQFDGWDRFSGGENDRVFSVGPIVQYYPMATRPLFVRIGLGWSGYLATDEDDSLVSRSVAAQVGAGYDFALSRSYLLTPFASYMRGAGGTLTLNGEAATLPAGVELLQYGLQISLR